ncbi:MAG: OmpA family protein [Acidobacteria bacterium]|nr:OmpA family protein [Acidobacteriota bacterium]
MDFTRVFRITAVLTFSFTLALPGVWAQVQPSKTAARASEGIKTIEVNEPGGQILGFRHLGGTTVVQMKGTKIEPEAHTEMKIESRPGFIEIDINRGAIKGLKPARRFGKDFLTYVLWAVSVDGEPSNLGEITFQGDNPISIDVTTPYQTFWLMVTAEPDFAVNDPSPVVVMYSTNQDSVITSVKAIPVPGKLLYYTYYAKYDTSPAEVDRAFSNELQQARKAVELAASSGVLASPTAAGEEPLPDEQRTRQTLAEARNYMQQAEDASKGGNHSDAASLARTAAQIAENARALALGAAGGLYERQLERELTRARGEMQELKAEIARLTAENASLKKASSEQLAACQRELEGLRTRLQQLETENAQQKQRIAALEQQVTALQEQLKQAQAALQQAQAENARLREDREKICGELNRQLNSLGQLTQQGGNMVLTLASDILFDLGSYELKPVARENLARLSALRQLLFAGANVRYEGHTDRVGEDDYNQWLSEQRALSVYRYFLEEQLAREQDAMAREAATDRLNTVKQLLAMQYAATRRGSARTDALARLGGSILGKGEREPVEDVPGASERNRRVLLLFPPAQTGQASSLCEQAKQ